MKSDQQLAKMMLECRDHGFSVLIAIRKSPIRYLIHLGATCGVFTLALIAEDALCRVSCVFASGMLLGAFFRDLKWISISVKRWPFTVEVTDWEKVEAIAESDDESSKI